MSLFLLIYYTFRNRRTVWRPLKKWSKNLYVSLATQLFPQEQQRRPVLGFRELVQCWFREQEFSERDVRKRKCRPNVSVSEKGRQPQRKCQ